jgi:hypothetical protein
MGIFPYFRRGCIEHDFSKGFMIRAIMGTEAGMVEMGVNMRSSEPPRRAVREWRLKIFTKTEGIPSRKKSD